MLVVTPTTRKSASARRMRQRAPSRCSSHDQFGDHRVVMRRDFVALLDAGIDADVLRLSGGGDRCTSDRHSQETLVRVLGSRYGASSAAANAAGPDVAAAGFRRGDAVAIRRDPGR